MTAPTTASAGPEGGDTGRRRRRLARSSMVALSALSLLLSACGGSSNKSSTNGSKSTASTATTAEQGLSGRWRGEYEGEYTGTFVLKWTEAESQFEGEITLSKPGFTTAIQGHEAKSHEVIFGTAGSPAPGTPTLAFIGKAISKEKMEGRYQTPKGVGHWIATKVE